MDLLSEGVPSLLLYTVGFLLAYALLLNLYFVCKNGLYARVNCWFCNGNTRVPFAERNSFQCPFCHQYNGFDKDGGYNRVIEEQHRSAPTPPHSSPTAANGLCEACNRHQQLKVVHLANYEPLRAADYDKEIEHFEAQLEKTFALCKPCTRIVKATIRRQNAWIFGNLLKTPGQLPREAKRLYQRLSPPRALLLVLSLCSLGAFCGLLPKTVSLPSHVFNLTSPSYWPEGAAPPQCSSMLALGAVGVVLELLLGRSPDVLVKVNSLLAWGVLALIAAVPFKQDTALYCETLQVFCSLYLTYVYGATCLPKEKRPPKKRRKQKPSCKSSSPELNEHFNELNIGPPPQTGRTASPNPFTSCCYGAGPDVAFVERPPRTLLSPSRLDNADVFGGQGLLRTRYVSGFYREGPYWAPVYSAKADYFCPN